MTSGKFHPQSRPRALGLAMAILTCICLACSRGIPQKYLSIHEGMGKSEVLALLGTPNTTFEASRQAAELSEICALHASTILEYQIDDDSSLWVVLNESGNVECSSLRLHPIRV